MGVLYPPPPAAGISASLGEGEQHQQNLRITVLTDAARRGLQVKTAQLGCFPSLAQAILKEGSGYIG